ncbi:hypothetical protein CXG81DRAFT_26886 [Caulochytrium protostelioides]|uniref:J domain-containing protein n=1 Tax=Caulochytrium protostelioides TaxID=1555241 RepID=A0A4V1IUF9_9FUNG|nr:hypothetical protein CXG81DRAFT_26886 [Caulochytrium protostelioides]|eukprot:RKP00419.1 hypothetical protein CXG81DRAFT_26886 [Caulochytrium protostelioides]
MDPADGDTDVYALLGVPAGAPLADIERAFRRLSLTAHPDKLPPTASAAARAVATDRFQRYAAAVALFRNPQARATYDAAYTRSRAAAQAAAEAGAASDALRQQQRAELFAREQAADAALAASRRRAERERVIALLRHEGAQRVRALRDARAAARLQQLQQQLLLQQQARSATPTPAVPPSLAPSPAPTTEKATVALHLRWKVKHEPEGLSDAAIEQRVAKALAAASSRRLRRWHVVGVMRVDRPDRLDRPAAMVRLVPPPFMASDADTAEALADAVQRAQPKWLVAVARADTAATPPPVVPPAGVPPADTPPPDVPTTPAARTQAKYTDPAPPLPTDVQYELDPAYEARILAEMMTRS